MPTHDIMGNCYETADDKNDALLRIVCSEGLSTRNQTGLMYQVQTEELPCRNTTAPLFSHYPEIIAAMPQVFTSHQFILELAHANQRLYVEALYGYRDSTHRGVATPFRAVHGILSRRPRDFPALVTYLGEVPSTDIFGQSEHWPSGKGGR